MKKLIIILLILFTLQEARSQILSEIFQQKKMDIKYLMQQIAALEVYIGYVEKGYHIAQDGLTTIGKIKNGEFNLHSVFYGSLKTVNPAIAKYSKVADIITYQLAILTACRKARQLKNLNGSEWSYMNKVYSNLSEVCLALLDELTSLITDDQYEMKDNERIKRIDLIYLDMKDKYAFVQSFGSEAILLNAQREHELGEIGFLRKLE